MKTRFIKKVNGKTENTLSRVSFVESANQWQF